MDWHYLRTILWLRWRLTRNQWSRGGWLNAVLTMIILIGGFTLGLLGAIGGALAGFFLMGKFSPEMLLGFWDAIILAFLFFWVIGLVSEIQRSESIDISKMLHLPISLNNIFVVNYLASHLTLSIILFLPAMLGLSLGLLRGRSLYMILMFPLVLCFIFMITAWTYCLRGWLVTLMVNKRRRRAIIAGITFVFILVFQLPNLLGNILHDHNRHKPRTTETVQSDQQTETPPVDSDKLRHRRLILSAHNYVPFLWVGNGVRSLAVGNPWPAVLGAAGSFFIGGLGLRRAYRSTVRFYQGLSVRAKKKEKRKRKEAAHIREESPVWQLPGMSAETSALASVFFQSMKRAPEIKMMLATNLLILLVCGGAVLLRRSSGLSDTSKPFIATGAVAVTFFGMSQLMFNMFGADRNGFRMLVLLPVPRQRVLLGKNLACLPIVLVIGLIVLLVVKFAGRVPVVIILAAMLQLMSAFLLLSMVGNLSSVLVPYRIAPGSMKATKTKTITTVMIILSHMLFPLIMLPLFFVPVLGMLLSKFGRLPAGLVNILLSAALLGLVILLYRMSLAPLGDLLQRREKKILEVVTQEVE
jgi:ABC-2 type transport system permease protein